jgi:hypothetical protein
VLEGVELADVGEVVMGVLEGVELTDVGGDAMGVLKGIELAGVDGDVMSCTASQAALDTVLNGRLTMAFASVLHMIEPAKKASSSSGGSTRRISSRMTIQASTKSVVIVLITVSVAGPDRLSSKDSTVLSQRFSAVCWNSLEK